MKSWNQWVTHSAILLFVMTACFIKLLPTDPALQAASLKASAPRLEPSSVVTPNDGSSYSLKYHQQRISASSSKVESGSAASPIQPDSEQSSVSWTSLLPAYAASQLCLLIPINPFKLP